MKMIEAWQKKAIYALGNAAGLVERGREDDNLHQMVEGMTGKEHVSALTYAEAQDIICVLKDRMRGQYKARDHEKSTGGITAGQRKKIWALMYQLSGCDMQPSSASLGDRLCGIIKRELHIDATPKQPLRWLTYQQGSRLIEAIKNYINSTKAKAERGEDDERTAGAAGTIDAG